CARSTTVVEGFAYW
nr:immunoglobulin heavy chain junction region [Mus musculus]MBK4189844.1 immunoglobulin heavy chain junction region [Mus musculus]